MGSQRPLSPPGTLAGLEFVQPHGKGPMSYAVWNGMTIVGLVMLACYAVTRFSEVGVDYVDTGLNRRLMEVQFASLRDGECEANVEELLLSLFAFAYSFLGICTLHNLYAIHHVKAILIDFDVNVSSEPSFKELLLPVSLALPKIIFLIYDATFLRLSFGPGLIVGVLIFNSTMTQSIVAYFGNLHSSHDPDLRQYRTMRDSLFFVLTACSLCIVLNVNDESACVLLNDRFTVWRATLQQQLEFGEEPLLSCLIGSIPPVQVILVTCILILYLLSFLVESSIKQCCRRMEESGLDLGTDFDIDPEEAISTKLRDDEEGAKMCCGYVEVEESWEVDVEHESLLQKCQSCLPYSILVAPYILIFHLTLDMVYNCLSKCSCCCGLSERSARILASSYVLAMCTIFYAGLMLPILYGLDLSSCVWQLDAAVIGVSVAAFFLCAIDVDSSVGLVRKGESADAVALIFSASLITALVGTTVAAPLASFIHADVLISASGPKLWSGIAVGIPLIHALALWRSHFKFSKGQSMILAALYVIFIAFFVILPRYCLVPICIELDCSTCQQL